MGQNIKWGFILKMRNYWSVGAGVPTKSCGWEMLEDVLSLGWVFSSQQYQNILLIFKITLQELEIKIT